MTKCLMMGKMRGPHKADQQHDHRWWEFCGYFKISRVNNDR